MPSDGRNSPAWIHIDSHQTTLMKRGAEILHVWSYLELLTAQIDNVAVDILRGTAPISGIYVLCIVFHLLVIQLNVCFREAAFYIYVMQPISFGLL